MKRGPASFDRLARIYRGLEFLAFGRDLERARFCLLDRLAGCRDILVLGEGDGRCLARLLRAAPAARVHCLDASAAMLARAAARVPEAEVPRVAFTRADAIEAPLPEAGYDAVVTLFFLDCFTGAQAGTIVAKAARALRPGSRWLFADFALPPAGLRRLRARAWLALLYGFFRWQTALPARSLPPSEDLIAGAGFRPASVREFQHGLLRAVLFEGPSAAGCSGPAGRASHPDGPSAPG